MAGTAKIIVDASVALKWFLEEEWTREALALRDDLVDLVIPVVPSLFFYEVTNVLRYKEEFGIEDVTRVLESLLSFQFSINYFSGEFAFKSVEFAYKFGITIYDASYLALGDIMDAPLITADQKLLNKARGRAVVHLRDWSLKSVDRC